MPESQNDLRRMQLRELALLNGTLRESDGPRCSNCGSTVHRSWQCPDKPNVTNNVICTNCNGVGHIARDCKEKKASSGTVNQSKIDEEYMSLMAELGEGPPPKTTTNNNTNNSFSGPTIGLMPTVPKAIVPPPPPLSQSTNTGHTAHTPLLPTPNIPQQNNSWNSGPTAAQTSWPSAQTPFSVNNSNTSAYPINDSYSQNNIYSQTASTPMPWTSTGIRNSFIFSKAFVIIESFIVKVGTQWCPQALWLLFHHLLRPLFRKHKLRIAIRGVFTCLSQVDSHHLFPHPHHHL